MGGQPRLFDTDARRFCRHFLLGIAFLAALVAGFDAVVDPYLVIGAPRIAHFNAFKPASQDRTALAKPYLFARMRPQMVIFGSSKAQVGIDPNSPLLPVDAGRVFDLGWPGAFTNDLFFLVKDAADNAPVRRILVLVDLVDFIQPLRPSASGDAGPDFMPDWRRRQSERAEALLSFDALRDSVLTVLSQDARYPSGFTDAGRMLEGDFQRAVDVGGAAAMFDQKRAFMMYKIALTNQRLASARDPAWVDTASISQIAALCRERHIALDIAIAPVHAEELRAIVLGGLWPRYEAAKRVLTATVAAEGDGQVGLWDFMGFDPVSTEAVPPSGDRAGRTEWFWEPNHFRAALGEKMLATIYHGGTEFGRRLTPQTIDAALAQEATAQARDAAAHSRDYDTLRVAMQSH
jgi:hypothetical protein